MMVFTFYTEQCTSPSRFHNFEISQGKSNWSQKDVGIANQQEVGMIR